MLEVIRLTENHKSEYSLFVAAQASGSFLQSWSWGDFQSSQGKIAIRYGVFANVDNEKILVGTIQLLQTKIPRLPGYYVYSPYGPIISEEISYHEVIPALMEKLKTDFATAWFIRVEPKDDLPIDGKPCIHIQPGSTLITDLIATEEELLSGMHQKTRYNIKVAAKHGVAVEKDFNSLSDKINQQALDLIVQTGKRQGYKAQSKKYYEQLLQFFVDNKECQVHLYKAVYEGQCVAAAIIVDHGHTRTYLFGGSSNEHRNLMAPYAMHWQAIQDAKNAGLTSYDWWGTETATGATPGFVQFKLRWGGVQKFYAEPRDIVLNNQWYFAYKTLRKVNRLI
ncbi:MAG TPA: peptidoglycan bridge formation glycyltransferase FemA/FemB family protein [Patescibacteria group bacterium]|jgi:lipid II:glycine glycyltransferase (peptidoglycan interpeptide bridge formation enzyme)|nr:peptidoglycan bridge formation glycyltransferase FemA/FemB family protein [Patescibacteria group bacterium]